MQRSTLSNDLHHPYNCKCKAQLRASRSALTHNRFCVQYELSGRIDGSSSLTVPTYRILKSTQQNPFFVGLSVGPQYVQKEREKAYRFIFYVELVLVTIMQFVADKHRDDYDDADAKNKM